MSRLWDARGTLFHRCLMGSRSLSAPLAEARRRARQRGRGTSAERDQHSRRRAADTVMAQRWCNGRYGGVIGPSWSRRGEQREKGRRGSSSSHAASVRGTTCFRSKGPWGQKSRGLCCGSSSWRKTTTARWRWSCSYRDTKQQPIMNTVQSPLSGANQPCNTPCPRRPRRANRQGAGTSHSCRRRRLSLWPTPCPVRAQHLPGFLKPWTVQCPARGIRSSSHQLRQGWFARGIRAPEWSGAGPVVTTVTPAPGAAT